MKLVQLNAWSGRLLYNLPRFLARENPDIACLQEVYKLPGTTGQLFATLDDMSKQADLPHKFMAPVHSHQFMERTAEYGIALLSKLPLDDQDAVFVHGSYLSAYNDDLGSDHARNFQHATVTVGDKKLHILNYHGEFIRGSKLGNERTNQQIEMLDRYATTLGDEPVIIAGDFNLSPESPSMRPLDEHFRNLAVERGVTSTYSPILHVYDTVCDYLFMNSAVRVKDFRVAEDVVSDHKALILEFDV